VLVAEPLERREPRGSSIPEPNGHLNHGLGSIPVIRRIVSSA
jgi:hypothetical protein